MRTFSFMVISLALCVSGSALAQAVYKHVDKDGKVYYSDKPPAKDDTRTKKIDVDANRNVIPPLSKKAGESGGADDARIGNRLDLQNRLLAELKAAQEKLAAAKEALEEGKTPLDDEWMASARAGGGRSKAGKGGSAGGKGGSSGPGTVPVPAAGNATGMIPSDAYYERVANLERAVAKAEAELAKAEEAYRRGVPN
jgi:hypothetical protein